LESAYNKGALSTFPPPRLRLLHFVRIQPRKELSFATIPGPPLRLILRLEKTRSELELPAMKHVIVREHLRENKASISVANAAKLVGRDFADRSVRAT
jgi:hypothetical protein